MTPLIRVDAEMGARSVFFHDDASFRRLTHTGRAIFFEQRGRRTRLAYLLISTLIWRSFLA